jgi:MFS family permease
MAWRNLPADVRRLLVARALRMFGFGAVSVTLALHLAAAGWTDAGIGTLLLATLWGDTAMTLALGLHADRWGRRRTLLVGAGLMLAAGAALFVPHWGLALAFALTLGTLSPTGSEVGPFLAVEQAALAQLADGPQRTALFAWSNLMASWSTAFGALAGGWASQLFAARGWSPQTQNLPAAAAYAGLALAMAGLFAALSPAVEAPPEARRTGGGLKQSRGVVALLSGLFALDAFGGGLALQALLAAWLHRRFGYDPAALGTIFFAANLLAGLSGPIAAALAKRIGLLNVMVWTHAPSNLLLIVAALMPNGPAAVTCLLLRFSISQMDVPTRQAFTMAVVPAAERAAAATVTGVVRTLGAGLGAKLCAELFAAGHVAAPLVLAGCLKLLYDGLLYVAFRRMERHA